MAPATGEEPVERRDIEALLATRQELGPTYDTALVESFADRIERALDEKVGSTVDNRRHREMVERRQMIFQFVLGAASMVAAIPIQAPSTNWKIVCRRSTGTSPVPGAIVSPSVPSEV